MKSSHITLADVAQKAGVSRSAASKALSGGGGLTTKISESTRQKILAVAKELNYLPNTTAQLLRSGKSNLIGLMLTGTQDRFYNQMMNEISLKLAKRGYSTISSFFRDVPGVSAAYNTLIRNRPAGIISCHSNFEYNSLIPTVIYGYRNPTLDTLYYDVDERSTLLLDYLESLNLKRVGIAGTIPNLKSMLPQRDFISKAQWQFDGLGLYKTGVDAARHFLTLKELPQAIISVNDVTAISLMAELQANGVRIPDDISILGCDNIEEANHVTPRLSTICSDITYIAEQLIEMLSKRIEERDIPQQVTKLDFKLIERNSCKKQL